MAANAMRSTMKSVPQNNNISYHNYCLLLITLALFLSQLNSKSTSKKYRITDFKMLKCYREIYYLLNKEYFHYALLYF